MEVPQKSLSVHGGQTPPQPLRAWAICSLILPPASCRQDPAGHPWGHPSHPAAGRLRPRRAPFLPSFLPSLPLRPGTTPARGSARRPRGRWRQRAPQAGRAAPQGSATRPRVAAAAAENVLPQVLGVANLSVPPRTVPGAS